MNIQRKRFTLYLLIILNLAWISLFAQYDPEKSFTFLKEIFDRHEKQNRDFLITELNYYIDVFPEGQNTPQVLYMLGKVYEARNKKHDAIGTYLKMFCLYPDVANASGSTDALRQLVITEKSYAEKKDWLVELLNQKVEERSRVNGYYHYLNLLVELDQQKLYALSIKACRDFIRNFPTDRRNDLVLRWIGDFYQKKGNYTAAELSYFKINVVYPESPILPYSEYQRGVLLYKKLGQTDKALDLFGKIVEQYPNSTYAADALFLSGEIKLKKQKDYRRAITDYRKVVENFPEHPNSVDALWIIAEINEKNLKDYRTAISAYEEIVTNYTESDRSIEALQEIADIYKNVLKDYAAGAEAHARIAQLFPDYEDAPSHLFTAGEICEKNLDDPGKAITYYQRIIDKYADSPKAESARKKIEKLQKKTDQ